MIIQGAATLAYDENEVHITIKTEPGEVMENMRHSMNSMIRKSSTNIRSWLCETLLTRSKFRFIRPYLWNRHLSIPEEPV